MSPMKVLNKKMGELLIERGIIAKEHLELALQEQHKKGGYLSQHLISMGFASEFDIANCLASQYGFAYLPLENYLIPPGVLETVPLKLIKIYCILPVDIMGEVLSIATADPLNDGVIEMVKQITGYNINVFISTYSELNQAIERYLGAQLIRELDTKDDEEEEDELRKEIAQSFIQSKAYASSERRRHPRIDVDLEMVYFLEGKSYKAQIRNISYGGVFFLCSSFIPIDTNLYTNARIYFNNKEAVVYSVVQIVRVEKIGETGQPDRQEAVKWNYGIAGFFNFISKEDKVKLRDFLKGELSNIKKASRRV